MNTIREINRINERELELGLGVKGSWHDEFKDSAYIYVGGLSYELTEGDVITVFSQWGEIADVNLPRDKETGKTKGFGFVMYEDQKSTVLAVDNMNGAQVVGRTIRVDHCRNYKQPGSKNEDGEWEAPEVPVYNALVPTLEGSESESDSESSVHDSLDEEDPMAAFIRAEKKKAKKAKALLLTDGKTGKGKRRREGESKEERRKRKEAKRAKRKVKSEPGEKSREGGKRRDSHEDGQRERDVQGREREENRQRDVKSRDREDKRERERERADRDDWRDGKFELEQEERRRDDYSRERNKDRDDRGAIASGRDYDKRKEEERDLQRFSSRNEVDERTREGRAYSREERYGSRDDRRSRGEESRNGKRDEYRDSDRRDEYGYHRRDQRDRDRR